MRPCLQNLEERKEEARKTEGTKGLREEAGREYGEVDVIQVCGILV